MNYFPSSFDPAISWRPAFSAVLATLIISFLGISMKQWRKITRAQKNKRAQQLEDSNKSEALQQGNSDLSILSLSGVEIISAVQKGQISAVAVASSFIETCKIVQNKTIALTETCFVRALEAAKSLDQQSLNSRGPLAGLPISVKDCFDIAGFDSSCGQTSRVNSPAAKNALLVDILQCSGALILTKTNVPPMATFGCWNFLFGRTTFPLNPLYTPGGSTGGEGALLMSGGSRLGVGTDIGGSVRLPAHFCGLFALKPTSSRISTRGVHKYFPGQQTIPETAGFLSRSIEDLTKILQELWKPESPLFQREPSIPHIPFNDSLLRSTKPLRIGYFLEDDISPLSPPCSRAVSEAVSALRSAGHSVEIFQPPSLRTALTLYCKLLYSKRNMKDDILTKGFRLYSEISRHFRSFLNHFRSSGNSFYESLHAAVNENHLEIEEYWEIFERLEDYREEWNQAWKKANLDCLITAVHPLPAMRSGAPTRIPFSCGLTIVFNLLDFPAGVAPVTKVKSTDVWAAAASHKDLQAEYHLDEQINFPVGVQVIGQRWQDELVLRCLKELEGLTGKSEEKSK